MPRSLCISRDGRRIERPDGTPFFYLADTAWELFHRLTRDEAVVYLRDRAAKGFSVIQAVVLAELDGLNTPNAAGHRPLIDNDPLRPNEAYFEDIDFVVHYGDYVYVSDGGTLTVDDYRRVYKRFKANPYLQDLPTPPPARGL